MRISCGMQAESKKRSRKARATLTERQVIEIANESFASPSTVRRWAKGEDVLEGTDRRIQKAVAKLGIEIVS